MKKIIPIDAAAGKTVREVRYSYTYNVASVIFDDDTAITFKAVNAYDETELDVCEVDKHCPAEMHSIGLITDSEKEAEDQRINQQMDRRREAMERKQLAELLAKYGH